MVHSPPTKNPRSGDDKITQVRDTSFVFNNMTITLSTDWKAIKPLWFDLQNRASVTVYQHYFWQRAWMETLGREQNATPLFIVAKIENMAVLLLPLTIVRKNATTIATWMGDDHANYCFGLCDRDHAEEIAVQMPDFFKSLAEHMPDHVDVMVLHRQPHSWDNTINPLITLPCIKSSVTAGSLTLTHEFSLVLNRNNPKRKRKKLRTQERALEALGGYEVIRSSSPDHTRAVYQDFLAQKKKWFIERGIRNVFADETTTRFFSRLAEYSEKLPVNEELLQFDYIWADNHNLALLGAGIFNGQHFGYFTSMTPDIKYRSISPGALIFHKRIEAACIEGMRRFDFGVGAENYKKSWCNEEHQLVDIIIPLTIKGRLYAAIEKLKSTTKRRIKKNEMIWSIAKKMRRKLA